MHEIVQRRTADAQQFGRLAQIAVDAAQHAQDGVLFGFVADLPQVERGLLRRPPRMLPMSAAVIIEPSAMITARLITFSSSRTLPGHGCASIASSASGEQRHRAAALLGGESPHERVREQRGVALAVAQRRNLDDDLGQPVVQVLAELAGRRSGP